MLSEQVPKEHGDMNHEEQVNDHIYNVVEDDGTNTLIHDSFNVIMDDHHHRDYENIDDFDDVHDLPLLEKEHEPLYEGSNRNILSSILLIMNLKVMNGLSNISVTQMLKYVICSFTYI